MKIRTVGLGFVVSLLLYACNDRRTWTNSGKAGDLGPQETQISVETMRVRQKEILFSQKCSSCHGDDGTAGIANASNLQFSKIANISAVLTITNGKGTMPAFKKQLTNEEIAELSNYVMTLRKKRN